jgi:hypothetical protein
LIRKEAVNEAAYKQNMLKSFVDAFRDRTSMLVQIGARSREAHKLEEFGSEELSVKDRANQALEYAKMRNNRNRK